MHGYRSLGQVLILVALVLTLSSSLLVLPSTSSAQEEIYGIKFGTAGTFAEFHGFVNARYVDFQSEGFSTGGPAGTSTFDVHNLYIAALAKIHPRVSIFGEVEYEHAGIGPEINVDRAFIDWKAVDQYLTLRLGSFNPPFGYELAEYVAPIRKFESRPFYVDEILFHEWVDVGLWGRGQIKTPVTGILYDLSILNGPNGLEGEDSRQNRDNNSDRTFLGRIALAPTIGEAYSQLGFSYAIGKFNAPGTPDKEFKIYGIDALIQIMGLDLRGEYAKRTGDDDGTIKGNANGYYIQASYKTLQGRNLINYIEPKIRYDKSDMVIEGNDEFSRTTVGINYSPYPHFLFKTEYQFIKEKDVSLDNDGFMISAVVDF